MSQTDEQAIRAWLQIREERGRRATVIDLYRFAAEGRRIEPHELPLEERRRLTRAVAPVIWPGFSVTDGSERSDPIEVVNYREEWPRCFEQWRRRLETSLGSVALRIDHVGSTSVPGLLAKPIVDIQVSVADLEAEHAYVHEIEALGVQLRSRDTLHRYFRPFPDHPREVHVHVCQSGSDWEREHLLFRDYLREDPGARLRYAEAKREAVRYWADDGWGYTDAKTEAIMDILVMAETWAAAQRWAVSE